MTELRCVVDVHPAGDADPELCDPAAPLIHVDDLAAVRGDGIFETLMVRDGEVHNLDRHRRRFVRSAAMLDLPAPDTDRWDAATRLALDAWNASADGAADGAEASLRWIYSRGRESTGLPTGWVSVAPASDQVRRDREDGVAVMTAHRGYTLDISRDAAPWALVGAKTLSYAANMAALRYARDHGLQDVIFTAEGGRVLEGPTSTVVAVLGTGADAVLVTPSREVGILPGTTQAELFRLASTAGWTCEERELTVDDLLTASGVWLVSSVRRYARVTALDGTPLARPERADEIEALATAAAGA
jgi:4-amino-4-deoxychorismate lyase